MKLLISILRDSDWEIVSRNLIKDGFRVTRISSTGGFLRRGMSTMMSGVEDSNIDQAIEIIRANLSQENISGMRRAVIFVINVEDFIQL